MLGSWPAGCRLLVRELLVNEPRVCGPRKTSDPIHNILCVPISLPAHTYVHRNTFQLRIDISIILATTFVLNTDQVDPWNTWPSFGRPQPVRPPDNLFSHQTHICVTVPTCDVIPSAMLSDGHVHFREGWRLTNKRDVCTDRS
jgi:hypothetical protein